MKWLFLSWLGLMASLHPSHPYPTLEATLAQAEAQDQAVLLYFSGSDWCLPCIKFKRQVLADSAFQAQTDGRLQVFVVDFPRQDSASAAHRAYKQQLAERYNPQGAFPSLLLLDARGEVLWRQGGYRNQSPTDLLAAWHPWLTPIPQP